MLSCPDVGGARETRSTTVRVKADPMVGLDYGPDPLVDNGPGQGRPESVVAPHSGRKDTKSL